MLPYWRITASKNDLSGAKSWVLFCVVALADTARAVATAAARRIVG